MSTQTFRGVIDTTLRDGQQSPLLFDSGTFRFSREDKEQIFRSLVEIGVRYFEFFSPAVSKIESEDYLYLRQLGRTLTSEKIHYFAHCRCHKDDISLAVEQGFDGLNLYIGINDLARKHSHGLSREDILTLVEDLIKQTRKEHPDLYIRFSVEDCFRTELSDIYEVYDRIAPLVNALGMPDTVGIATPELVRERVLALRSRYPNILLECHFHNDRGFSLINAVAAVQAGASFIDTSVWGLAERSGITSITALLLNLYLIDPDYTKSYNLKLAYPVNVTMGSILQWHVPHTEPVSVTNRTHIAGVHQKAVLNEKRVYEGVSLELFGVTAHELLLGPLSGWNLIHYYLREILYAPVSREQSKEITRIFKERVGQIDRGSQPEAVLMQIIDELRIPRLPPPPAEAPSRIENLEVSQTQP